MRLGLATPTTAMLESSNRVKGEEMATSTTIHSDEADIKFERHAGGDYEAIGIDIREGPFGEHWEHVTLFIGPKNRAQVAAGLRNLAHAIDGGKPVEVVA